MIRLRFISATTWDAKIVQYDTRCAWNHVEAIRTEDWRTLGALPAGGVAWRSIDDPCYASVTKQEVATVNTSDQQTMKFWDFLVSQLGKPYDWRAIFAFGMGDRDWTSPDSWFCSELVARAAQLAGVFDLPVGLPVSRLSPRDVWMLVAAARL